MAAVIGEEGWDMGKSVTAAQLTLPGELRRDFLPVFF